MKVGRPAEAEEQNYNQIDNVLNNGFEQKKEEKEKEARGEKGNKCPSLKRRLEEKKELVVSEQHFCMLDV